MKKIFGYLLLLIILLVFAGTAMFLYNKSKESPIVYEVETPELRTIVNKTVANGKVIPRKEVNVSSQVSGVVEEVYVVAGQTVDKGDLLAKITLVPNMVMLNNAESQVESAKINLQNAKAEYDRQRKLYDEKLISRAEYDRILLAYDLRRQEFNSAENNVLLLKEGATRRSEKVSNIIHATVDGMVLDVPNKEGAFIVESSTYGAGTPVAVLADMEDMIFEGLVDESEVGKIREGMELVLSVGALQNDSFTALLEYISPKGITDQGTIKFQIRASVTLNEQLFLRANYSANADIVLERREDVLTINEGNLLIENGGTFVEVQTAPQTFEKRAVTTGLSDGIHIEIVSGLGTGDQIKKR